MKDIKQFITESNNPIKDKYPNVKELGLGEFNGVLWGHCFAFEGKKYYSDYGWMNCFPSYCKMVINEKEAFPYQTEDKYQRPELKKLYD